MAAAVAAGDAAAALGGDGEDKLAENTDDLAALAACEAKLYEGLTGSDPDMLSEVFADDLVYIHSQGIAETKDENLTGQRSGLFVHGPIERLNGGTTIYGDLAVTNGQIDMVDLGHGPATTLHLQQTLVWKRDGGSWRLLLRQATRVPA